MDIGGRLAKLERMVFGLDEAQLEIVRSAVRGMVGLMAPDKIPAEVSTEIVGTIVSLMGKLQMGAMDPASLDAITRERAPRIHAEWAAITSSL